MVTFPAHSVKQLNIEACSPEWSKVVELFPWSDPVKFSSPIGKIDFADWDGFGSVYAKRDKKKWWVSLVEIRIKFTRATNCRWEN